jgi:PAS domain S-box-containing protein
MQNQFDELRRRAERLLQQRQAQQPDPELVEVQDLLHELGVYQTELELQNQDLRQAQQALAESRDRYAALYDRAPVGYLTLNSKGIVQETNLTLAGMLDVPGASLTGAPFSRFVRPAHRDLYYEFLNRLLRAGVSPPCDLALYHPQQEDFHARLDGAAARDEADHVTQLQITVLDVTARVRAERERAQALDRVRELATTARRRAEALDATFNAMIDAVIVVNADGRISQANPAATAFFGPDPGARHPAAITQQLDVRYPDGRPIPDRAQPYRRALRGYPVEEETLLARDVQGRRRTLLTSAVPLYEGEEITGAVVTWHNVTHREEMRARLAAIIQHAPEAILVTDAQARLVQTNPAVERLFGRPLPHGEPYEHYNTLGLLYPGAEDCPPRQLPFVRAALDGETLHDVEMLLVQLDGEERIVRVSTAPIGGPDATRQGAVAILQDVTRQHQTRQQLRQYADRLQILHRIDQAILAADSMEEIATAAVRYVCELVPCRRCSAAVFEFEQEELQVLAVESQVKTQAGPGWRGPLQEAWFLEQLQEHHDYIIEDLAALPPTGWLMETLQQEGLRAYLALPLVAHGELMGLLELGSDRAGSPGLEEIEILREMADELAIGLYQAQLHARLEQHSRELERLVAERTAELQRSEAWFRSIFEDAAVGITVVDAQGHILASNPALQEMLGYSAAELEGLTFAEITHPDDVAASAEAYQAFVAGQGDHYRLEKRYVRRDGETVWALLAVSRVQGASDAPALAISTIQDTTERKRALAALIQSEKLAVTGRMATSIAHEINNPLQAIRSNLELVQEFELDPDEEQQHLAICQEELTRLSHMTRRVLDFSRPSQETPRPVAPAELIDRTLALMNKKLEHSDVRVGTDVSADLPAVRVTADQIIQVLINVLVNALDALPDGGDVRIAAHAVDQSVAIELSNTGPPIPPEQMDRIFEPFFSTKPEGSGLGLSISHNIVQRHGGTMYVENLPSDQGVCFTIQLPASPQAHGQRSGRNSTGK